MRLASIYHADAARIGAEFDDNRLIEIGSLLRAVYGAGATVPSDMLELLESGDEGLARVREARRRIGEAPHGVTLIDKSDVRWRPPVPRPGKICGVAMNNSASNARKISAPDHPAFFLKPASCLVGHAECIRIRTYYGSVHPEPELACIIGKTMRKVDAEDALGHVAGFSIFDDITGNGMRAEDMFHYWAVYASDDDPDETKRVEQHLSYAGRYKGADTFGVLGPWLVTTDEVADPDDLAVRCSVGGMTVAEDSTRYYNFKVAEVLSFISQFQTLDPGDVVSCGTAFKPSSGRKSIHHANLQTVPGPVSISIEGLGTQENPVVVERVELGQWRLC